MKKVKLFPRQRTGGGEFLFGRNWSRPAGSVDPSCSLGISPPPKLISLRGWKKNFSPSYTARMKKFAARPKKICSFRVPRPKNPSGGPTLNKSFGQLANWIPSRPYCVRPPHPPPPPLLPPFCLRSWSFDKIFIFPPIKKFPVFIRSASLEQDTMMGYRHF